MNGVTGRRCKIAIVAEDRVNHVHTGLGIHTPDENGLGCKMLVEPALETLGILINVIVNHQANREWCAIIRRVQGVVGSNIDSRENVIFHARIQLGVLLVILEVFHTGIEHIILAQLLGRRARCSHQDEYCGEQYVDMPNLHLPCGLR